MTSIGRLIWTAGMVLGLAAPAWAQSNPDPQVDPVKWLSANLGGAACVVYDVGPSPLRMERFTENTEVQFDGCRMVLQQATEQGGHSEIRTFRIALGDLATNAVSASEGFFLPDGWTSRGDVPTHTITIAAPAGQSGIDSRLEPFDGSAPRDYRTGAVTLLVRHEEVAVTIVRALTRAIELCRERR
jgi:hypothetical protein